MFACPQCGEVYPEGGFCGVDGSKLAPQEDDPILGTTIGAYQITALLGVGGWGRVYLGVQPEIGGRVAIKILNSDHSNDERLVKRFFNEARAVNMIRHENIVNIIDLSQLPDGQMYIVMEYLDGAPLSKYIAQRKQLGISETCRLCSQVLDALAAAHENGIVHRDIKPENLFVTPEGRAKILDFGIAKLRAADDGSQTGEGAMMGTPHFMSPEQAQGKPVDPRSDLYSMGVILFNCLAGVVPFEASSVMELARAHVSRQADSVKSRRSDVPDELDALVARALEKDPDSRWQSAQLMATELRRIAHANPGNRTKALAVQPASGGMDKTLPADTAVPKYPTPEANQPGKQGRRLWLLLAPVVLAAVALLAFVWGQSSSDSRAATSQADIQSARPINLSAPMVGLVGKQPQFYRFDAEVGQTLTFIIHADSGAGTDVPKISLLTEGGQKLELVETETQDESRRPQFSFTASKAQPIIVVIVNPSAETPEPFNISIGSEAMASAGPSGGLTEETAQSTNLASPIDGVVNIGETRHYRFLANAGMTSQLTIHTEMLKPGTHAAGLTVKVKAEDGRLLRKLALTTYSDIEEEDPAVAQLEYVIVEAQPVRISIENMSKTTAVHYKISSAPVGRAHPVGGGLTAESAQEIVLADSIDGVADLNETRFYRFDPKPGQSYQFSVGAELMQPGTHSATISVRVKTESGVELAKLSHTSYADITEEDPDLGSVLFAVVNPEPIFVAVKNQSKQTPVHFQVESTDVGPSFPLSGGLAAKDAEPIDLKGEIEGVIDIKESRHYRFETRASQTTTFTIYTELMKPQAHAATLTIKALAEDGEKLAAGAVTTYADITTLEQAKADVQVVTVGPKSVLLILENSATASPVHYRMVPAARASEP